MLLLQISCCLEFFLQLPNSYKTLIKNVLNKEGLENATVYY